jgi:hypothetical protein
MDKVSVDIALYFVKIVLVLYIVVSIWWPMREVNWALNTMAGKAVLLLGIVVAAMFDVPLAILFTATMIIAVVSEERPAPAKAASAPEPSHIASSSRPSQPQSQSQPKASPQIQSQSKSKTSQKEDDDDDKTPLMPIDIEILQLAHVSEDRLVSIQTSAIDPSLVGYEEDVVATVDMSTILVERDD